MSSRWKKVWADFWINKSRTFLTIITIAVGVLAVGFNSNLGQYMAESMDSDYLSASPSEAGDRRSGWRRERVAGVTEADVRALGQPVAHSGGWASVRGARLVRRPGVPEWNPGGRVVAEGGGRVARHDRVLAGDRGRAAHDNHRGYGCPDEASNSVSVGDIAHLLR